MRSCKKVDYKMDEFTKSLKKEDKYNEYFDSHEQLVNIFMYFYQMCEEYKNNPCVRSLVEKSLNRFFLDNLYRLKHFCSNDRSYDQLVRNSIKELYNELPLYHYTTYGALKKIIGIDALESIDGKMSLKMNHVSKMNDCEEGEELTKILHPKCERIFNKYKSEAYSFSFTTCEDDAAQWERYARPEYSNIDNKSDCGVCIKFSRPKLMKFIENHRSFVRFLDIFTILYSTNVNPLDAKYIDALIRYRAKSESESNQSDDQIHYDLLLAINSCAIKNESFKNEYEIRLLLLTGDPPPEFAKPVKDNDSDYVLLKLGEDFTKFISSITIGPDACDELKKEIRNQFAGKVDVIDSKCSLRPKKR